MSRQRPIWSRRDTANRTEQTAEDLAKALADEFRAGGGRVLGLVFRQISDRARAIDATVVRELAVLVIEVQLVTGVSGIRVKQDGPEIGLAGPGRFIGQRHVVVCQERVGSDHAKRHASDKRQHDNEALAERAGGTAVAAGRTRKLGGEIRLSRRNAGYQASRTAGIEVCNRWMGRTSHRGNIHGGGREQLSPARA
jgi:hypothetical protein